MHPKTAAILADLKARGIDVSGLETSLNAKPDGEKFFMDGFTRTPEFTKILNEKRTVEGQLQQARTDLAAAQTTLNNPNSGLTPAQITELRAEAKRLRDFLVSEDYPDTELNNVGLFKFVENIATPQTPTPNPASPNPSQQPPTQNQQGKPMTEEERQQLLRSAATSGAALGLGFQMQVQKAYAEFAQIYGRFPTSAEISQLETALADRTMQNGEAIDVVAGDVFNFAGKRAELAATELQTQLAAAKAEGRAEVLQQHPELNTQPLRGVRRQAPVASHFQGNSNARITSNSTQNPPPNSPVPPPASVAPPPPQNPAIPNPTDPYAHLRNPTTGLLPYQERGNAASRLHHLQNVVASKPELFEAEYQPLYGNNSPQT